MSAFLSVQTTSFQGDMMQIVKTISLAFVLLFCLLKCAMSATNGVSVAEVINKYEKYVASLQPISCSLDTTLHDDKSAKRLQEAKVKIRFDGSNLYLYRRTQGDERKDVEIEYIVASQYGRYFEVLEGADKDRVISSLLDNGKMPLPTSKLAIYGIPLGYISLEQSIYVPDLLRAMTGVELVDVNNEEPDKRYYLLKGRYGAYAVEARVNPELGYVLSYFRLHRNYSGDSPYILKEACFAVDSFLEQGRVFPKHYTVTSVVSGGDVGGYHIEESSAKYDITNTSVEFKPLDEVDFNMTLKLPNGSKAYMLDAPQIEYIWMDGKIEPKTDELMLRIARGGHRFIPGPKEPRFWFMAIGLVMILVGGGLKLRQFLNEKS